MKTNSQQITEAYDQMDEAPTPFPASIFKPHKDLTLIKKHQLPPKEQKKLDAILKLVRKVDSHITELYEDDLDYIVILQATKLHVFHIRKLEMHGLLKAGIRFLETSASFITIGF